MIAYPHTRSLRRPWIQTLATVRALIAGLPRANCYLYLDTCAGRVGPSAPLSYSMEKDPPRAKSENEGKHIEEQ